METILPWKEPTEVIEPFYPNPQDGGGRPVRVERMLRIYFLQHWLNLSDTGAEQVLNDSRAMRHFVGIDLGTEPVPDETTLCKFRICKFRHLMERHNLGEQLFHRVNECLQENGLKNAHYRFVSCALVNLVMAGKTLLEKAMTQGLQASCG